MKKLPTGRLATTRTSSSSDLEWIRIQNITDVQIFGLLTILDERGAYLKQGCIILPRCKVILPLPQTKVGLFSQPYSSQYLGNLVSNSLLALRFFRRFL